MSLGYQTGRKRKSGLFMVREPNGRPSRQEPTTKQCSPGEVRRLRDAAMTSMRDPEWGTQIGRLFLEGKLTADRFEAGKRWAAKVAAYHKAILARPNAPAIAIEGRGHSHPIDPGSEAGQLEAIKDLTAISEMEEAHAVLIGAGMLAEQAVRHTCEQDEAPVGTEGLNSLDIGLLWLSSYWGLTTAPKNVRNSKSR